MLSFVKRFVFSGKMKSSTAAHIFLILCFYAAFTTVYAYFIVDFSEMLMRLGLGALIVVSFVVFERSRLSRDITAFLSPAFIISVMYVGTILSGDVLIFIYTVGGAMISLTYLKPKSLLFYLIYNIVIGSVLVFALRLNMLGGDYSSVHNMIFFVASVALSFLVYVFCVSYARTIDSLIDAENKAALAAKAKGNFLARMSHEIRTPLNAIVGLTEMQLRTELPKSQQEALVKIQSSGNLLLGIINDILDLSKIESGRFDLVSEPYVTADILNDIINLNMVRIGQKPIRFEVDIDKSVPCGLVGDSLRIKQLLSNLLSNAFKYTQEGVVTLRVTHGRELAQENELACGQGLAHDELAQGQRLTKKDFAHEKALTKDGFSHDGLVHEQLLTKESEVKCDEQQNERVRLIFKVIDTGIGMSEKDQKRLFSEYSRVNQTANKAVEGTGLGLSICKWLTELMDGSISVQSEPGKGSVFTAEIVQEVGNPAPLGAKNAEALRDFCYSPAPAETALEFVQMPYGRVLVVDDVEMNLMIAEALMEPYGMSVDLLGSGSEAVERIKSGEPRYDIIFMDHMMPGMDGIETVAAIRSLDSAYAKTVPIVALSANAVAGSEKMFLESGFQSFVAKPIDTLRLDGVLRKYVYRR